jgi:hypothetical protein
MSKIHCSGPTTVFPVQRPATLVRVGAVEPQLAQPSAVIVAAPHSNIT